MTVRRYRVLILEDDPIQGRLYRKILSLGPFEPSILNDPMLLIEGLESIAVPDVMLLDVMLPSMDGIFVLEQLESHPKWCGVPAVMMTASPTPARIRAARKLPIPPEGFLAKPVNPESMRRLILDVIESSDAAHLKQRLQRQKRAIQIGVCADYEEIQRAFQESCNVGRELAERMARNRREAQRLRIMQSQLTLAPADTQRSIGELLSALEQEREGHKADAERSDELRNRILETKKAIRRKQLQIREIEHQLHVLSSYSNVVASQRTEPQSHSEDKVVLSSVGNVLEDDAREEEDLEDPGDLAYQEEPGALDLEPAEEAADLDPTGSDGFG